MTNRIWYPHALQLPTPEITHFTDVSADHNYSVVAESSGSSPFPCFVGASSAAPAIAFSTRQLKDIFDTVDEYDISKELSAGDLDLFYAAGKPNAWREDASTTEHIRGRWSTKSMLYWNTLRVQQGVPAEIDCMIASAIPAAGGNPVVFTDHVALEGTASCKPTYMLGPYYVDGQKMIDNLDLVITNNLTPMPISSGGSTAPVYLGLGHAVPTLAISTNQLDQLAAAPYGGSQDWATSLKFFLQKRSKSGMLVPPGTAEHIKISISAGLKLVGSINQMNPARTTVMYHLHEASAGNQLISIDTESTIP